MKARTLGFVFIFFFTSHTPSFISNSEQKKIVEKINFLSLSPQPGAAVAVKSLGFNPYRVCLHQQCVTLSQRWKLLSTDIDGPSLQPLLIEDNEKGWFTLNYNVSRKNNSPVKLRLPASLLSKLDERENEIELEKKRNSDLLKYVSPQFLSCRWSLPLSPFSVVSEFGSSRMLPNGSNYFHTGLDLRASLKTPVKAVSDGRVLSAEPEIIGGNVINIDHGGGVVSRYLHLSQFKVSPGESVTAGQLIAFSGESGRAEGPHLHWEMRIRGSPVDPVSTLRLMSQLCDLK